MNTYTHITDRQRMSHVIKCSLRFLRFLILYCTTSVRSCSQTGVLHLTSVPMFAIILSTPTLRSRCAMLRYPQYAYRHRSFSIPISHTPHATNLTIFSHRASSYNVTPCSLGNEYRRFKSIYFQYFQRLNARRWTNRLHTSIRLHGVTFQNTTPFLCTAHSSGRPHQPHEADSRSSGPASAPSTPSRQLPR
jgi:hypothetical protein